MMLPKGYGKTTLTDTRLAFDLDGTVTMRELLPTLAEELGLSREITHLTRLAMDGGIDFAASFQLRFAMLRTLPLTTVHRIADAIPLDPHMAAFIKRHSGHCAIVTGNLDVWIEPIVAKLGCAVYSSRSITRDGKLEIARIMDKAEAVQDMARTGARVVAIGDAANDIPMFKAAHIAIAYAGLRKLPQALINVTDRVEDDPAALCRLLQELLCAKNEENPFQSGKKAPFTA